MRLRKVWALVGVLAAAAIAGPASASAVTIGNLPTTDPGPCPAGVSAWFVQSQTAPTSPSYTVPAGGGLITSWSTAFGTAGAPVELLVTSPFTGTSTTVVGVDAETLPTPLPSSHVSTFTLSHPIVVQAGDLLGLFFTHGSNTSCLFASSSSSDAVLAAAQPTSPPVGTTLTATAPFSSVFVDVSANLDQSADLALTGAVSPGAVTTGNLANFAYQVTSTPTGVPATLTDTLPVGLTPVAASSGSAACAVTGQAINCPLSTLPTTVNITVKGASAGTYTNSAQVTSTLSDSNPGNNTVSNTLMVVNPPPSPQCTVPKLKGAPLKVAKAVLPLVNCRVGKVTKAKSKSVAKGDVISTKPGAGSTSAAGTKVAIKVSKGKPKKKHKKKL